MTMAPPGVEPVMGFCTPEETGRFLELAPTVEKARRVRQFAAVVSWQQRRALPWAAVL
jgi:polyphosphate kinase 2 (PPK2 family)